MRLLNMSDGISYLGKRLATSINKTFEGPLFRVSPQMVHECLPLYKRCPIATLVEAFKESVSSICQCIMKPLDLI
jgi:hypothetical protein